MLSSLNQVGYKFSTQSLFFCLLCKFSSTLRCLQLIPEVDVGIERYDRVEDYRLLALMVSHLISWSNLYA